MIIEKRGGVTVFRSALFLTVSAVVETDDLVLVVDPCWLPHEVREIRSYVDGCKGDRPLYLLFTHSDYDHIIGYGAFPEATVIASQAMRDRTLADQAAIVEQVHAFDDEYYITRDYPTAYPAIDLAYATDGEQLALGSTVLTFYQAPGHNPDGMFTVVEPIGLLIAGDYLSDVEFPYIYHDSRAYERTLSKLDRIMARHRIILLMTGHGHMTDDRKEMERRQREALAYIAELRDAAARDDRQRIDAMLTGHAYPRAKKKFHTGNEVLIRQELQEGRGID